MGERDLQAAAEAPQLVDAFNFENELGAFD
jgi:hypothetical protein